MIDYLELLQDIYFLMKPQKEVHGHQPVKTNDNAKYRIV